MEELKFRVRELENELLKCKQSRSVEEDVSAGDNHTPHTDRPRIENMSAEVVDTNRIRTGKKHNALDI